MFDYIGARCPYCKEQFKDGDDIAVCPECGTPHHRACFAAHGECAALARHAECYDWQQAESKKKEAAAAVQCPDCGCDMLPGSRFCNHCGQSFPAAPQQMAETYAAAQYSETMQEDMPLGGIGGEYYNSVMQNVSRVREFDGITLRDWMVYIGRSAPYYLGYFKIQDDTNRKTAFTLSAMLMPFLYFIYRKLWLIAGAAGFSSLLLALPYAASMFHEYGLITLANPSFWTQLSNIFSYVGIAVNFLWGIFAVRLYRSGAGRQIRRIKLKSADEATYQTRLSRAAGPSAVAVTIVLGAAILLLALASRLLPEQILLTLLDI